MPDSAKNTLSPGFESFPVADADLCVKCALCLPHCPTYKLELHEGDSPRGRIALMQGLAQGALELENRTLEHLDGCLTCRACEPVCPAQVPYGRLIDAGRHALWQRGHRPGFTWRALAWWRKTPGRLRWLTRLLRLASISRLAALFGARLSSQMRAVGRPPAYGAHQTSLETRGSVALFLGCLARPLDADTAHASIRLLHACGYVVNIPADQGCCGAMDTHAGDRQTATKLARQNIAAFAKKNETIITTASGCGVQLKEYGELLSDTGADFGRRVTDVMSFLAKHMNALPDFKPLNARVLVHATCTLKNGMRESGTREVLRRIPQADVQMLAHADCCGAAGSYVFEHPNTADALGRKLLAAAEAAQADILITSNFGCALHLRRLIEQRGLGLRVCHPAVLLAEQLPA